MKRVWPFIVLGLMLPALLHAQAGGRQQGTVVRMRMADCLTPNHPLVTALAGMPQQSSGELCPEYTLLSSKVVYVIVGKMSGQLVPLAENIRFRFHKNELLVRVDDENRETHFLIREMILRSQWDTIHERRPQAATELPRLRLEEPAGEIQ